MVVIRFDIAMKCNMGLVSPDFKAFAACPDTFMGSSERSEYGGLPSYALANTVGGTRGRRASADFPW